jgi:adenosylmethionine-8-amino-7-oxononanoate aminotransferase
MPNAKKPRTTPKQDETTAQPEPAEGDESLTALLREWDDAHLWHPFTAHERQAEALMFVAGDGHYLVDIDGNRYLDGVSSLSSSLFGHRRPEIDAAISAQLGRVAHATLFGNTTDQAVRLAHRLVAIAPEGLTRVFFSDTAAGAVDAALKMAYQYWQQADEGRHSSRQVFLTLGNAYHGDTIGALSVSGIEQFQKPYKKLLFSTLDAHSSYCYRCPNGYARDKCVSDCMKELEQVAYDNAGRIAGIVVEPGLQMTGRMITQPDGYLAKIHDIAEKIGALLIHDESMVGFGRSGTMFASEQLGVTPDFLCLANGLTAGYLPMAATLTSEKIFQVFNGGAEAAEPFFHGDQFAGNPLAAAAALASLDLFEQEGILEALPAKITRLERELGRVGQFPCVGEIRQFGLAAGIELVADGESKAPYPREERRGARAAMAARAHGVFVSAVGDIIVLMPPLTIEEDEIKLLVDAVVEGIRAVCGSEEEESEES